MNIEEQTEPGPGANGILARATVDDLIRELKTRCTAMGIVMVVEDEDGEDVTIVKHMGSRLVMLGALEEIKSTILSAPGNEYT